MQELDILADKLGKFPEEMRTIKEEVLTQAGNQMLEEVRQQIDHSGIRDSRGRVKSWQETHMGSGRGYTAVRATASSSGPNSPGAITNYLEHGHKIRNSSQRARGYHFYTKSKGALDGKILTEARQLLQQKIAEKLEGMG